MIGIRSFNSRFLQRVRAVMIALAATVAACGNPGEGMIAFDGATLWDGTGAPPMQDAIVIVDSDGKIVDAGQPDLVEIPKGAQLRRLDGRWIIPGLIDAHTHVERWMLAPMLASGITAARDAGGYADSIAALREDVSLLTALGPRLFISGAQIDAAPAFFPAAEAVGNASQARRAIDQRVLLNATQAMLSPRIDLSLLRVLMDEANALSFPVAAHLGKIDATTAVQEGVSTIEHLSGIVEATVSNPRRYLRAYDQFWTGWKTSLLGWVALDSASLDRTAVTLADAGAAIVPTLSHYQAFAHLRDRRYIQDLDLSAVPEEIQSGWNIPSIVRAARITNQDFRSFRRARPKQDLFVRRFRAAGGIIAAGSNAPHPLLAPGTSLHDELRLLVEAGLTTKEALLAATRDAARLLGVDSIGTIRAGNVADFVVLSASPLEDIGNSRSVEMIIFRGQMYVPADFAPEDSAPEDSTLEDSEPAS